MMPHRICLLDDPVLVALNVLIDLTYAASYFAIPSLLVVYARSSGASVPRGYRFALYSFAVFVFGCGVSHVLDVLTMWWPIYFSETVLSAPGAVASAFTVYFLSRVIPGWTLRHWRDAMELIKNGD